MSTHTMCIHLGVLCKLIQETVVIIVWVAIIGRIFFSQKTLGILVKVFERGRKSLLTTSEQMGLPFFFSLFHCILLFHHLRIRISNKQFCSTGYVPGSVLIDTQITYADTFMISILLQRKHQYILMLFSLSGTRDFISSISLLCTQFSTEDQKPQTS